MVIFHLHPTRALAPGTLRRMLTDGGIDDEEFRRVL
jgi:predicted RNA binding protein YcfA (HicA-like mRNA interferase family)